MNPLPLRKPRRNSAVLRSADGICWFEGFGAGVNIAISERRFTRAGRQEFLTRLGIEASQVKLVRQVHGSTVLRLEVPAQNFSGRDGDALATSLPGTALGVLTADCIPAFFWDPAARVIGIAHAGWRGLKAGVLSNLIQTMKDAYASSADSVRCFFGPAIRSCCYEVGEEFAALFPGHYQNRRANLIGFAFDELLACGLRTDHIYDCQICTACPDSRFFSARRENTAERILSLIWKPVVNPGQN